MFKPVKAKTLKSYFASLSGERKNTLVFLDKYIKKVAPNLKPIFSYNMPGYGTFKYKNYKKEIIDWPVVAMASQKNYISIYVCALDGKQYVAEKYKKFLGKVSVGKSCIRFKKLEDLDLKGLKLVLEYAVKFPGLLVESKKKV
jgi:uncharacterized protein YdhG (YjbR/CyaY superfamily)